MSVPFAAHAQTTLRYDLKAGDHLVFQEKLDRSVRNSSVDFATHTEWTNHVLVASDGTHPELLVIGTQRNRMHADLLRSLTNGKDTSKADRKDFDTRLSARGPVFVEANQFDRAGMPLEPLTALREWTSQMLFDVREVMPLPAEAVSIGSSWRGTSLLGVATRYAANEPLHGHDCVRMEGEDSSKTVQLKSWFCPSSGLTEKVEFSGKYPYGAESTAEEKVSIEFIGRTRGEPASDWAARPDTREAWLQLAMLEVAIPVEAQTLRQMIESGDTHLVRRALALWYRRKLAAPSTEILTQLLSSANPRVRTLAALFAVNDPTPLKRATSDTDYFVRRAVTPIASPACLSTGRPKVDLPPGDYWMTLRAGPMQGWPFIVHIPEEYRTDGKLPAIVYLNGGAGHALDAMSSSRTTEESSGYILIYPQARDYWWGSQSIGLTRELLKELKSRFAIDPERLYLTGMSNGGTGVFLYATLWPDQFAAAVSLMGAGFDTPAQEKPLGENTSALPLLFVHGDQDKRIPVDSSIQAADRLKGFDRSAPVELTILKGKDHELTLDENGGNAERFFERYERNPYPKKLHIRLRDLEDPRQYWVEILDKSNGTAEVDARIEGNVITVKSKNIRKMRLRLRPEIVSNHDIKVVWNGKEFWHGTVLEDCTAIAATAPDGDFALGYSREVLLEEGR